MRGKPIYCTRVNDKGELYTERYPIIYENSKYIYFKPNNQENLDSCLVKELYNEDNFIKELSEFFKYQYSAYPFKRRIIAYTLEDPNEWFDVKSLMYNRGKETLEKELESLNIRKITIEKNIEETENKLKKLKEKYEV